MQRSSLLISAILLCITFVAVSCSASKVQKTPEITVVVPNPTYTLNVKPIIDDACGTKCHKAEWKAGGIDLSTYETVKEEALHGQLLPAIQHAEGVKAMPKNAEQFDAAKIQQITNWINTGAPL